jgi:hypothetical protein
LYLLLLLLLLLLLPLLSLPLLLLPLCMPSSLNLLLLLLMLHPTDLHSVQVCSFSARLVFLCTLQLSGFSILLAAAVIPPGKHEGCAR